MASRTERKRVMVVDDHPLMRSGLAQLINQQAGLEVCGEAGSPAEAMGKIPGCRPDLIVADITMKESSGLEFIKNVLAIHGNFPILVVSMHDETIYAERALRAGACGYIMKEESADCLVTAIQRVLDGGVYLSETMSARLLKSISNPKARSSHSPLQKLTDREFEVFQLIGRGNSTKEIAEQLHLSASTVDVHRAHIREKLHLKSATALVYHAVQWVRAESGV
jgi:DNA-binding NarL/FixJ family response regulator